VIAMPARADFNKSKGVGEHGEDTLEPFVKDIFENIMPMWRPGKLERVGKATHDFTLELISRLTGVVIVVKVDVKWCRRHEDTGNLAPEIESKVLFDTTHPEGKMPVFPSERNKVSPGWMFHDGVYILYYCQGSDELYIFHTTFLRSVIYEAGLERRSIPNKPKPGEEDYYSVIFLLPSKELWGDGRFAFAVWGIQNFFGDYGIDPESVRYKES
jgi:hypothetical protein